MKIHPHLLPVLLLAASNALAIGCDIEETAVDDAETGLSTSPSQPAQPFCNFSAPFDGGCASKTKAAAIVSAGGGQLVDWSLCYDAFGAKQPGCMLVMARQPAGLFSYRLRDTACTRGTRGGCYGGYRVDYRTRELAVGYASGGDSYMFTESAFQRFRATGGWETLLTTKSTTYLEGVGGSSGLTLGFTTSALDATGQELWSGAERTTYLPSGGVYLDCEEYAEYVHSITLLAGNEHFVDCANGEPFPGLQCEGLNIEAWADNRAASAHAACVADPAAHLGDHHIQPAGTEPTIPTEEMIMDWDDGVGECTSYEGPVTNVFDAELDGAAVCCEATYDVSCGELVSGECGCMRKGTTSIVCVPGAC